MVSRARLLLCLCASPLSTAVMGTPPLASIGNNAGSVNFLVEAGSTVAVQLRAADVDLSPFANLALQSRGASCSVVSRFNTQYGADKLIDDDNTTDWYPNNADWEFPWAVVTLPQPSTVWGVRTGKVAVQWPAPNLFYYGLTADFDLHGPGGGAIWSCVVCFKQFPMTLSAAERTSVSFVLLLFPRFSRTSFFYLPGPIRPCPFPRERRYRRCKIKASPAVTVI
jgi:hypothetical protein